MLLKRRSRARVWEGIRGFFWPRKSFLRSARYLTKRVLRLTAAPHAVAAGVAAGVFASFLPFLGFHFLIAACVAYPFRGNIVASALGTAVGNPITFPFIWAATLGLGRLILYGQTPANLAPLRLGQALSQLDVAQLWAPLLKPMTVGGVPLGAFFAIVFYFLTKAALVAFRERKRIRLAAKPHKPSRSLG
ncbi:DUF2062 domain-containing protein [Aminobacter sp. SS-2016]|uniref:DUF2062 domain-containing protein n=1 Tax=Aminobacter sp. Y103A TaxID=1870862 RepID=UPI002572E119|nr:DUF2062 domain-containing protein [Aminobacter sp. SS-2016]